MSFDDFGWAPAPTEQPASPAGEPAAPPARERVAPLPVQSLQVAPPARQTSLAAARAKAGLGVVVAGMGAGAGAVLGGPLGALAGLTGVGALRNLYRAQGISSTDPEEKSDAARSLALGVIGVAIVGFIGYKIYSRKDDD